MLLVGWFSLALKMSAKICMGSCEPSFQFVYDLRCIEPDIPPSQIDPMGGRCMKSHFIFIIFFVLRSTPLFPYVSFSLSLVAFFAGRVYSGQHGHFQHERMGRSITTLLSKSFTCHCIIMNNQ